MSKIRLVIHGGAGTILREKLTANREKDILETLGESITNGYTVLESGGTALDAVQKAVNVMEDSPLFNTGRGAVFTADGEHEQDAMIMEGHTLEFGAIAGVKHIANPINLARLVLHKSDHAMLVCEGAEEFARKHGMRLVDKEYFYTDFRWKQFQEARERDRKPTLDHSDHKTLGTVGAVALDRDGHLAAATSTGGMTYKQYGRVGDTPIVGSGTFANENCAISSTGHGEYIMRRMVAYDIAALIEYKKMSLADAAKEVICRKLNDIGGDGGAIALDREGNFTLPFNTLGMYRGYADDNGEPVVAIFKE